MTIISFIAIHSQTSTLYIVERFSWLYSQYFSWSSLFELEPCLLLVFWHSYCFLVCLLSWLSPTVLQDKAGTDAAGTWCAHVTPTGTFVLSHPHLPSDYIICIQRHTSHTLSGSWVWTTIWRTFGLWCCTVTIVAYECHCYVEFLSIIFWGILFFGHMIIIWLFFFLAT